MKIVTGDIWQYACSGPLCIPTNGYLTRNGIGVMGRGLALQAKQRYPDVSYNLGRHLQRFGNTVGWILLHPVRLIAVPVKPVSMLVTCEQDRQRIKESVVSMYTVGVEVPGYHCKADPEIIRKSLNDLLKFMIKNDLDSVYLPLLGCGNGDLDYKTHLLPILQDLKLPDSITLVHPWEHYDT
jgi:hypothetical protein